MQCNETVIHEGRANAVDVQGDMMAIGDGDSNLQLFKRLDGKFQLSRVFSGFYQGILCVKFSADGAHVASGGSDTNIQILNLKKYSRKYLQSRKTRSVIDLTWFADNDRLLSVYACRDAIVWSCKREHILHIFAWKGVAFYSSSASADSKLIAIGSACHKIQLWCGTTYRKKFTLAPTDGYSVLNVRFHPTDSCMLLSSGMEFITVHDLRTMQIIFRRYESALHLRWEHNGRYFLSSCRNHKITLWDFLRNKNVSQYLPHPNEIMDLAVATDATFFVTVSKHGNANIFYLPWYTHVDVNNIDAAEIDRLLLLQKILLHTNAKVLPLKTMLQFQTLLQTPRVNVNVQDADGNTALHIAMLLENEIAIQMLLNKGASSKIVNKLGRAPCAPRLLNNVLPPQLWIIVSEYSTKLNI